MAVPSFLLPMRRAHGSLPVPWGSGELCRARCTLGGASALAGTLSKALNLSSKPLSSPCTQMHQKTYLQEPSRKPLPHQGISLMT